MLDRRRFLNASTAATGSTLIAPWLEPAWADTKPGKPPMRFVFLRKQNGLFPSVMPPTTLSNEEREKEKRKDAYTLDLAKHELPAWMKPIESHKSHMAILQGLSGMMCGGGHVTYSSSLGVYKAAPRLSSIKRATVDFELARMFPSPLGHIELACSHGCPDGVITGNSARGPQQTNLAYGSPKIAVRELFKSVSSDPNEQSDYQLKRLAWEFMAREQFALAGELQGTERAKVTTYAESIAETRARDGRLEKMSEVIRKNLPKLDAKYFNSTITTVDRQWGHLEILLSTLISGMTNVVTFTLDLLGTPYTGLKGLEAEHVDLHGIGHHKGVANLSADEVRVIIRTHHMSLVDALIKRLKAVPEGDGNMFDNTTILYFPDNGEAHHSSGIEWPFLVFAGRNTKLNIAGKYIRLPAHGREGHKTLGNWYTTILNAYGNAIPHYGDPDLGLEKIKLDPKGPIKPFLA
ncbi:MAG: DUF1552 domain-containing protein [Gemmataceae bacterium]